MDLRVNNYFIVTLTLSAPSVWMRRGGIDVVTKMEGNCWKEKASNPKGRLGLLFLHRQHELTAAKYCVLPSLSLLQITDSAGHILYAKEDATKGKFAFTTEDYDMFEACFESKLPVGK